MLLLLPSVGFCKSFSVYLDISSQRITQIPRESGAAVTRDPKSEFNLHGLTLFTLKLISSVSLDF